MSTPISSALTALKPADPVHAAGQSGPSAKPSAPPNEVQLPAKPEIRYDPAEMRRNLEEAIQRINEQMKNNAQNLNFSFDQVADRTVITVKNTVSGEIIRQIPDQALLRVAHNIEELKGMLYNKSI